RLEQLVAEHHRDGLAFARVFERVLLAGQQRLRAVLDRDRLIFVRIERLAGEQLGCVRCEAQLALGTLVLRLLAAGDKYEKDRDALHFFFVAAFFFGSAAFSSAAAAGLRSSLFAIPSDALS